MKAIDSALENDKIQKAESLIEGLKEDFQGYKETIEKLEVVDDKLADLSERLASGEISNENFADANKELKGQRYKLEEKLNELRQKVIYEDYEKPF